MQVSLIEIAIIIFVLTTALFLCAYFGFRAGVRLGMRAYKGIEPEPVRNPVKIISDIKQTAEQEKAAKIFNDGFNNIFNYTGDPPKDGDE